MIHNNTRVVVNDAMVHSLANTSFGPRGPTGAQGAVGNTGASGSAATPITPTNDVVCGVLASRLIETDLFDKKAVTVDLVNGGYALLDDLSIPSLYQVENVPSAVITNSTGKNAFNRKHLLYIVAANAPAYDHLADGTPAGVLIEQAATNICLQSETFNTTWVAANGTLTTNNQVAPDGTSTADTFTENTTNSVHSLFQGGLTYSAVPYTFSCFLKAGTGRYVNLVIGNSGEVYSVFDLVAGTVGTPSGGVTATIRAYNNGWYRCTMTATPTAGGAGYVYVVTSDTNALVHAYLGTSKTYYLWGAQVELGTIASSYTKTVAASVTRSADVLAFPLSNFSAGAITLFGEFVPTGASNAYVAQLYQNSTSRIQVYYTNTSISADYYDGSNTYGSSLSGLTRGSKTRFAAAFDTAAGTIRLKFTGATTNTTSTYPRTVSWAPATLSVGSHASGTASWVNGPVSIVGAADFPWTTSQISTWVG